GRGAAARHRGRARSSRLAAPPALAAGGRTTLELSRGALRPLSDGPYALAARLGQPAHLRPVFRPAGALGTAAAPLPRAQRRLPSAEQRGWLSSPPRRTRPRPYPVRPPLSPTGRRALSIWHS